MIDISRQSATFAHHQDLNKLPYVVPCGNF
jgi:hypothetical protein